VGASAVVAFLEAAAAQVGLSSDEAPTAR
jgi:hypothetical protein